MNEEIDWAVLYSTAFKGMSDFEFFPLVAVFHSLSPLPFHVSSAFLLF